jgi:hypothetical protein
VHVDGDVVNGMAAYMVFVHVDGDVVNGMAAYQPVVLVCVLCGGRMKSTHTSTTG